MRHLLKIIPGSSLTEDLLLSQNISRLQPGQRDTTDTGTTTVLSSRNIPILFSETLPTGNNDNVFAGEINIAGPRSEGQTETCCFNKRNFVIWERRAGPSIAITRFMRLCAAILIYRVLKSKLSKSLLLS